MKVALSSLIITTIIGENETYKTVEFTYTEDGVTARIIYDVKYYVVNEYNGIESSYDANDYLNNSIYGEIYALPNEGVVKVLVIPVWFSDSDEFFTSNQQAQIIEDITYTMIGDRPDNELPSVEQYYETQSYGQIDMEITLSEFYYSSTSYKDYTDYIESKRPNTYVLGTNAINWYFENHLDEKFSDYDLNNDGFLDGLILYYGANYYGASSDNNRSVAFESSNTDIKYNYNNLYFCPIGGLYGLGKQDLSSQLEATDLSSTYSRSFRNSSRTVIHEIGHMFGNDDLYEEQFASYRYSPAGGFNMQEDNYGGFDPYHLNKIGWTKPQVYASSDYNLGDKVKIYLSDFQSSGQNIILTNKWNEFDSIYDEYLILELFAPTGVNKYDWKVTHLNMIETGIRLWHVNSLLLNCNDGSNTSEIISGNQYNIISSNYNVDNKYDLVHMIRNNPDEEYNTLNNVQSGGVLFKEGDSFDMETFSSQFINGAKLDNEDKLGWNFTIDELFENSDGTYGAIITLERVDNEKTEFRETVTLNRSDLDTPDGVEDYSSEIFGEDGDLTFIYKLVTPPSVYNQNYPISSNGMCLFASEDGSGGYIELSLKDVEGKDVIINSINITYSRLTNASLTVITNGNIIEGTKVESIMSDGYTYTYDVNSSQVIIQNMYNEIINHWSVIALYEITIEYTIK